MTAIANFRLATEFRGLVPARGTLRATANTMYQGKTLVSQNTDGRAVVPTDNDGFRVIGVSKAFYDNRTGSEAGGLDDSLDIEVEYGVFEFAYTGGAPKRGDKLFAVDNQTVSISPGSNRGPAGTAISNGENGVVQLYVGPLVLATPDAADVAAVTSDATSDAHSIQVPLTSLRLSTGAAIPAFSDGVADGFALVDSEAFGLRINPGSTTVFAASVAMPADLDDAADIVVHVLGFRVGASDTTAALTVGAFFQTVGAAHTADANAGGASTAFDGATTVVTDETRTLAAADVPPSPSNLTLTLQATAALDADDLVVLGIFLTYTRKLLT